MSVLFADFLNRRGSSNCRAFAVTSMSFDDAIGYIALDVYREA